MTDLELLKEARDALRGFHDRPDQNNLIHRIDSALADTGNTDAREVVKKIRAGGYDRIDAAFSEAEAFMFTLTDTEAAALIEQYAKRVPRVMLREIGENSQWNGLYEDIYQMQDEIAAKYGYKVEGENE